MPKLEIINVTSFPEVMEKIEEFQSEREFSWYRGSGSAEYSLIPSIARKIPSLSAQELSKVEKSIATTFAQKSPPFVDTDLSNEWRSLFYMQHYGIPTRLLDWSESPFVSLYFALTSVKRSKVGKPATDPVLWICDPLEWNRSALSHISFKGGILDDTCEEIKAYSPSADVDQRAVTPIMIYGTHNSPRIVAQRGVFALFGKGTDGMEAIYSGGPYKEKTLQKIIINRNNVEEMLKSLYRKGIAESTIYPDLVGLSMEIRRSFGYF